MAPRTASLVLVVTVNPLSVQLFTVVEGVSGYCLIPFAIGSVILTDDDGAVNSIAVDPVVNLRYLNINKPEPPLPPYEFPPAPVEPAPPPEPVFGCPTVPLPGLLPFLPIPPPPLPPAIFVGAINGL